MLASVLILAILAISGLIAYLGDIVGRKVGKRKLTLFGLRPKYTSIIITIITGILIAVFSVTIIMAASKNVRNAVFNIQEVLSELVVLSMQVKTQNSQLQVMQAEIEESENSLSQLSQEKIDLMEELNKTHKEHVNARNELQKAQLEIGKLEADRQDLLVVLKEQEMQHSALNEQRYNLEERIKQLDEKIHTLQSARDLMERDYYQRYEELGRLYQTLDQRYQEYSKGDIIYLRGEEVHWTIIYGGQDEQSIYNELDQFINEAHRIAEIFGIVGIDPDSGRHVMFYASDYLAAARELRQGEGRFIVRLLAEGNATRAQTLRVRFQIVKDYIVYVKGQKIFSMTVNPRLDNTDLEAELMKLFQGLRENALSSGILPDYSDQVGAVDFTTFFRLLEELRQYNQPVNIVVEANQDIWRIDSLAKNVEYKVVPSSSHDYYSH